MGSAHSLTKTREERALLLLPAVRPFPWVDVRRHQIARPRSRRHRHDTTHSGTPRDKSMRNPDDAFPRTILAGEQTEIS
jgi:hypothetical protein